MGRGGTKCHTLIWELLIFRQLTCQDTMCIKRMPLRGNILNTFFNLGDVRHGFDIKHVEMVCQDTLDLFGQLIQVRKQLFLLQKKT